MESARMNGWIVQRLAILQLKFFFWKNIVGSGECITVKTSLYLALRRSQQISSCLFGKMWFVVGLPNFHPCWCWLFRWGGGIVWTLNSMWPFFSQQRLLENLQSSEWTMIIACILKTQNTKLGWLFRIEQSQPLGWRFFVVVFRRPTKG